MSHYDNSTYGELSLEPMEMEMETDAIEDRLFRDFSSRDKRRPIQATTAEPEGQAASNISEHSATRDSLRKPAGKANFFTDDRRIPDRRVTDRRRSVRLTGDRRLDSSRRAQIDPWDPENSA